MVDLQAVFSEAALKEAWLKVRAKGRAGGIDNVTISDFENGLEKNLLALRSEVVNGTYVPEPYRLFFIEKVNKPQKEYRPLAMLTVKDKIAQHCVSLFFSPQFDRKFIDTSYAYREGKGHQKSIARVTDFVNRKYTHISNLDIDNFFDTIDRKTLFEACAGWFGEPGIMKLLEMWVLTGFVHHGKYVSSEKGIAQGGVLSPLLSNIYLHPLDEAMKARGIANVRYADNIVIFGKSEDETLAGRKFVEEFIREKLSLALNSPEKEVVPVAEGFVFCGILLHEGKRRIAPAKFESIKRKISLTIQQLELKDALNKLRESVEGFNRYYSPYDTVEQLGEIGNCMMKLIAARIHGMIKDGRIKKEEEAFALLRKYPEIMNGDSNNRIFIRNLSASLEIMKQEEAPPTTKAPPLTEAAAPPSGEKTEKEARRLVDKKRKVYYNKFVESLDMLISGNFAHIGKSGGKVVVRREGKVIGEAFASKLSSLIINSHGTTISADAVKLCIDNKVLVNYFDDLGKPFAVVFAVASGANSVSTAQAWAARNETGRLIVKNLVWGKITNQVALIRYITKNKKLPIETQVLVNRSIEEMETLAAKVNSMNTKGDPENFRGSLFGYEGSAAVSYWAAVKAIVPPAYEFTSREHQNASNVVNQMLNYGYGILYSKVLAAAVLSGLNPNIPFLHAEVKGKPALTYDLIEPFRPIVVDRTILSILSRATKLSTSGNKLPDQVRQTVASKVMQRLYSEVKYKGKTMTINDILIANSKLVAGVITGNEKNFKPYVMKW